MENITITTEYVKLQDALKLAALVSTGGEAKIAINEGRVALNGEICLQRGKKVRPGDLISYHGRELTVLHADR